MLIVRRDDIRAVDRGGDIDEVRIDRVLAFARGRTRGTLTPIDGSTAVTVDDDFIAMLRCEGGAWRVSHLMWRPRGAR